MADFNKILVTGGAGFIGCNLVRALLEKNRAEGLSDDEEREWERYEYLEHLVRMAKAKAKLKLRGA